MRIFSTLALAAAFCGALAMTPSSSYANFYPSCEVSPKPAGCGGRGPGSTTTPTHTGTSTGHFYPSCEQSPKPAGCGGRAPGAKTGPFYPSCQQSPKPAGCGGRK